MTAPDPAGAEGLTPEAGSDSSPDSDPLEEIRRLWCDAYDDFGPAPDGDGVQAVRRDGRGVVSAQNPEALWDSLVRDYGARRVELPP